MVRTGEKGSAVVYLSSFDKTETNERGEDVERMIPFLKQYTVFAVDQIVDLPKRFYGKEVAPNTEIERIGYAERCAVACPFSAGRLTCLLGDN